MPLNRSTPVAPSAALYRLARITSADTLEPGTYLFQRGADLITITLREPVTTAELATIVERVNSIHVARVA